VTATAIRAMPVDEGECARLLADASEERRTVRVAGAMTKSYLGELRATDIELRTSRLSGIVDHVPADLTVTVAAGTRLADLAAVLAGAGQFLPLDPPHAADATIGGIIAANSNGFWRGRYGGVRDLLIGTRAALADGTVVRAGGRVVKNVAGYDLNKLFTGSLGTLGVLVEATLKVLPVPPLSQGVIARFTRGADAFAAADALLRGASRPAALVVDRADGAGWRLLVAARGDAPAVGRATREAAREATARGAPTEALTGELDDLRELPARATDGALVRLALPLAAQAAFADAAARLDSFRQLVADAASAVHRVHLRGDDDTVVADVAALLLAGKVVGGTGRVERRAERLRQRLATWPAPPSGDVLMRRLKDAYDPAGILEPGRSALG
jgi:glycolate dehydrogenase FAD-binding subunit